MSLQCITPLVMHSMHITVVNKFEEEITEKQKLSYVKQLHLNSFNIPLLVSAVFVKGLIVNLISINTLNANIQNAANTKLLIHPK